MYTIINIWYESNGSHVLILCAFLFFWSSSSKNLLILQNQVSGIVFVLKRSFLTKIRYVVILLDQDVKDRYFKRKFVTFYQKKRFLCRSDFLSSFLLLKEISLWSCEIKIVALFLWKLSFSRKTKMHYNLHDRNSKNQILQDLQFFS